MMEKTTASMILKIPVVTFVQTTHKCKYFCKCAILINNLFASPEKSFNTAAEDAMLFLEISNLMSNQLC